MTGPLYALHSLCIRPLALSASVAEGLASGAPVVQTGHRHGAILALPGTEDSVFMSAPGLGLLPAHIVVRKRDLECVRDALAGAQAGALRLRIDAADARIFRPVLRPDSLDPQCARARAGIAAVAQSLRVSAAPLGLGVTAVEALAPGSRWLQYAAAVQDTGAAAESVLRSLIGFGAGTTPAGDDFIVGMLAHAWATRGRGAPAIAALRMLGPALPELTTAVSATYLRAAARGEFGSHLIAWVRALPRAPASRAIALAKRVAEHGATSGYDTLAGFVAAAGSVRAAHRSRQPVPESA
ncbi:MAG: DUF2877 domain-containing protein [Burkholderiales bacterium]|nr:DUF2877 domain-containing protein [Burkholderiales bacterium]